MDVRWDHFFSFVVGVSREETEGVGGCEEGGGGGGAGGGGDGEDMKSLSSLYLLPPMPRLFIASSFSPPL